MKSAKKGFGTQVHYENAEKEGFRLGLPEDWLQTRDKKKRVWFGFVLDSDGEVDTFLF